ncbi:MAG: hypothetical protein IKY22_09080 [Bacteroidales bacterium]|nr:hypothetical protein [Bacteroidales bacterium]
MNTKKYKNIIVALAALLMMGSQAVAQEYFQGKATFKTTISNPANTTTEFETYYRADGSYSTILPTMMRTVYLADEKMVYTISTMFGKTTVMYITEEHGLDAIKSIKIYPKAETINGKSCIKVSFVAESSGVENSSTVWIDTSINVTNKMTPNGKGIAIKSIEKAKANGMTFQSTSELISLDSGYYDSNAFRIPSKDEAEWIDLIKAQQMLERANAGNEESMDTLVNVILEYAEEVGPEIINNKIDETSDADFKRDTKEGITIVHFNAIWNFSNNSIGTKIKAIDTKHSDKVKVLYLDTEKCPKTKKKFKVKTIPTVIVMKDGKEIGRLLEVDLSKSEDKIWEKIEQIINK